MCTAGPTALLHLLLQRTQGPWQAPHTDRVLTSPADSECKGGRHLQHQSSSPQQGGLFLSTLSKIVCKLFFHYGFPRVATVHSAHPHQHDPLLHQRHKLNICVRKEHLSVCIWESSFLKPLTMAAKHSWNIYMLSIRLDWYFWFLISALKRITSYHGQMLPKLWCQCLAGF